MLIYAKRTIGALDFVVANEHGIVSNCEAKGFLMSKHNERAG